MYFFQLSFILLQLFHFSFVLCENPENVIIDSELLKPNRTVISPNFLEYLKNFSTWDFYEYFERDTQCKNHADIVLHEAQNLSLWALSMFDSSAKVPSGILSGNLNQFGDFDECLGSEGFVQKEKIKGKYCLANIKITFPTKDENEKILVLDNLIHAHRMLRNDLKDKGHRIARFETIKWGICVPSSCNINDIEKALLGHFKTTFQRNLIKFDVAVEEEVCYVKEPKPFSPVKLFVQVFFISIIASVIIGSLISFNKLQMSNKKLEKIFLCFSLKKNWQILTKTEFVKDEIKCLHGIRFLHVIALLLSHKQFALLFTPMPNRTQMSEVYSKSWTMIGRAAILYTDSFFVFSGLLASYSFIKDLDNKKKLNFRTKFINRVIRFTPNLFAIIFFCTYIMDSLNSGPQWGLVVTKYSDLCKKYMWRNFLYIHNHFGLENMCLTHTHQVGIDMQLFLLSPIFIYALWKSPIAGWILTIVAAITSTWIRYEVTYSKNLSTLLFFGVSVERLWKTASNSYILPSHRLTVYLMGILLGYFLRRKGNNLGMTSTQATVGWTLATMLGLYSVFGPYHSSYKNFEYDPTLAANYNAFAPITWCTLICWAVIACENGRGGLFSKILSWKYFSIFTRLSYSIYLTQFPVYFYNIGSERTPQYHKGFFSLFDFVEFGAIFIASIILTLTFDIPFQELKKTLTAELREDNNAAAKKQDSEITEETSSESVKKRRRLELHGT